MYNKLRLENLFLYIRIIKYSLLDFGYLYIINMQKIYLYTRNMQMKYIYI